MSEIDKSIIERGLKLVRDGTSIRKAAKEVGIDRKTLSQYTKKENVKSIYQSFKNPSLFDKIKKFIGF